MDVIASLIVIYCNNHFNYKGCEDQKSMCIRSYVQEEMVLQSQGYKPKRTKPEIYAEAYVECTAETANNCLNKN